MKRVSVFLLSLTVIATSCDPAEWLYGSDERWYFKNATDVVLKVSHSKLDTQTVEPGDSVCLMGQEKLLGHGVPVFEDFNPVDSIYVFTTDDTGVAEWFRSKADEYDRNLFSEPEWDRHITEVNGPDNYCWTFTFDDEDMRH